MLNILDNASYILNSEKISIKMLFKSEIYIFFTKFGDELGIGVDLLSPWGGAQYPCAPPLPTGLYNIAPH